MKFKELMMISHFYAGLRYLSFVAFLCLNSTASAQQNAFTPGTENILYVDLNVDRTASEYKGDGSSWANAVVELADALEWAYRRRSSWNHSNPLSIYVATGTYLPKYFLTSQNTMAHSTTRQDRAFHMVRNVKIYGGFAPESNRTTLSHDRIFDDGGTILSGDFDKNDRVIGAYPNWVFANITENANHVVISSGDLGVAELNGVTVSGGNADEDGGGIRIIRSHLVLKNVVVKRNYSKQSGGGIYINGYAGLSFAVAHPKLLNVLVAENIASDAAGIRIYYCDPQLVFSNVTVVRNRSTGAEASSGGVYVTAWGDYRIYNSIITANSHRNYHNDTGWGKLENTIFDDPDLFEDIADGNYTLRKNSPAINAGLDEGYTSAGGDLSVDKDLQGNPRRLGTAIDIGAYEYGPKPQYINGIKDLTKTYGDADFAPGSASSGLPLAYSTSNPSVAVIIGGKIRILSTGQAVITVSQSGNQEYGAAGKITFRLDVKRRPVQVAGTTAVSRPYNGSLEVELSGARLEGVLAGDLVSLANHEMGIASALVGEGLAVSTDIMLNGRDAGKYTLEQPGYLKVKIVKRTLNLTGFTAENKEYDGTVETIGTGFIDDRLDGDDLTFSYKAIFADKEVGVGKAVHYSSVSISGGDHAAYYELASETGYTIADIVPKPITVKAHSQQKVYGESDLALRYTHSGLVNGDTETTVFTGALLRTTGEDVGSYAINLGDLSAGENYAITFTGTDFIIAPMPVTVSAQATQKVYGESDPLLTYVSAPEVGSTLANGHTVNFTGALQRASGEDADTYSILQGSLANPNYNITFPGADFTITKASQQISFDAPAEVGRQGSATELSVSSSSGLPVTLSVDDALVASLSGTELTPLRLGTVQITATQPGDHNHHPAEPVTVTVRVVDGSLALPIRVHQAVSPNGDGLNDFLIIEGVRDYPDNRVMIFDRAGNVITEINGYDNNTNVFTGQYVRDGTYFYRMDVTIGGKRERVQGFFEVRR